MSQPTARRFLDLSHVIRSGLVTYPGLPAPVIEPFLTREASIAKYAPGTQFAMDTLTMIGNTGTYLDSPFHRYGDGADLAGLELDTLVELPTVTFHLDLAGRGDSDAAERSIPASIFEGYDLSGTAVLLDTGWSRHFGEPAYAAGAPFLSGEGAAHLVEQGVVLVGIDSLNIDDTETGGERPAHSLLLAAGIHVVEHLANLDGVPHTGSQLTAVPPRIEGFGTFPVRVYVKLPAQD